MGVRALHVLARAPLYCCLSYLLAILAVTGCSTQPSVPPPKDKAEAELRKLQAEIRKVETELDDRSLHFLTSIAQVIGGAVLLGGFLFSAVQWSMQRSVDRQERDDERFTSQVQNLGATHASLRAAAAAGLSLYLRDKSSPFRSTATQTLVSALGLESDPLVRRAIGEHLVAAGADAEVPLLELKDRLRNIVNPKFDLVGPLSQRAQGEASAAERVHNLREQIRALQDAFLVAAITVGRIRNKSLDLARAPFREMSLIEEHSDLAGANFRGAHLSGADFFNSNLMDANFSDTDLSQAELHYADLGGAVFTNADLVGASFTGARKLDPGAIMGAKNWEQAAFDAEVKAKLEKR